MDLNMKNQEITFLKKFYDFQLDYSISDEKNFLNMEQFRSRIAQLVTTIKTYQLPQQSKVAVLAGKTNEQLISLFSLWSLQLVYVPISKHNPANRVDYILEDANALLVIVDKREKIKEYSLESRNVLVLEDLVPLLGVLPISIDQLRLDNIAYIIYTSGSTGQPKGVVINFHNLQNLSDALDEYFQELKINQETFLQVVDFAFDVSISDMLLWMKKGGHFVTIDIGQNILKLVKYIVDKKVTYLCNSAPVYSIMGSIKEKLKEIDFSNIKSVITTASYCPPKTALVILELFPKARLYNCYGPTETTVYCCWKEIHREEISLTTPLSIGHPLKNLKAYSMIDNNLVEFDQMSDFEECELCIGGAQVFVNYHQKPDLTSEKTILNQRGEKVYRTGDLVYRVGQEFYYKGRLDDTIKVQGFRVNLGEIEINVGKIHFSSSQVVIPIESDLNQVELVLFFVPKADTVETENEMKQFIHEELKKNLPHYMLPTKIFVEQSLPLNNSGKIDKKKLVEKVSEKKS